MQLNPADFSLEQARFDREEAKRLFAEAMAILARVQQLAERAHLIEEFYARHTQNQHTSADLSRK